MHKKGNLHSLIHSLSKSEKRHFRLTTAQHGQSKNYLLLFDAIEKQEEYNEEELKKKFSKEKFVQQLHVTKNYLTKSILKSLRNYHNQLSKDAELKDLLRNIEILFAKELYELCYYEIVKAVQIAEQYEKLSSWLEVLQWKRRLYLLWQGPYQSLTTLREIGDLEKQVIQKQETLRRYWVKTVGLYKDSDAQDDGLGWRFKYENSEVLTPDSLHAEILHHHLQYIHFAMSGQLEKADEAISSLILLLESLPHRIKDDPSSYITALNNQISSLLHSHKRVQIPAILDKIRKIPEQFNIKSDHKVAIRLMIRTYNIELEMYRDEKEFEKGIQLIETVQSYIEQHDKAITGEYKVSFYYQFAHLNFMHGNLSASMRWLNKLFNCGYDDERRDIQSYARMLNLIIHLELGNITVLKYAVLSCRRFLKKRRNLQEYEKILLKFFSKMCTTPEYERKGLFVKLYSDLFTQGEEKLSESDLDYLDFKSWIEDRLPKRIAFYEK